MLTPVKAVSVIASAMLAVGLAPSPANAEWESVLRTPAVRENGRASSRCAEPHQRLAALTRSDRRALRLPSGWVGSLEVFGHGLDTASRAAIVPPANSGPAQARLHARISGAQNLARGCGLIGSVQVDLSSSAMTRGQHVLLIGDERVMVEFVQPRIAALGWIDAGSSATLPDRALGLPASLAACIGGVGGKATLSGTTLTLTLPKMRSPAAKICLARPLYFHTRLDPGALDIDFEGGAAEAGRKRATMTIKPTFENVNAIGRPEPLPDDQDVYAWPLPADAAGATTRRVITIRASGLSANALTLVVQ